MFWSREPSTIQGMFRVFEQAKTASEVLGIKSSVHMTRKPWAIEDKVGFGDAMVILWQSLQEGRHRESHQQFESIRKIRSLASTMQHSRGKEALEGIGFKEGNKVNTLARASSNSVLFSKFMRGCEKRMGRVIKQDAALSVEVLSRIMDNLEEELRELSSTKERQRDVIMLGNVLQIGFCDALRGNEVFLVEASTLCKYGAQGRKHKRPHVVIPLMGRFKGETGERNVIRVLADTTRSGLKIRRWVDRLIHLLEREGRNRGDRLCPAFCDIRGEVLSYHYMNTMFHDELRKVQEAHPEWILPEVDVAETYNLYRSLRRGATTRATALNYSETVINLNNRWRTTQSNKGKGGLKKMSQLYVDVSLVLDSLLEFSTSL
jgi:hypothetical protein